MIWKKSVNLPPPHHHPNPLFLQIRCSPLIRPVRVLKQDGASGYNSAIYFLEWVFYLWVLAFIVLEVKKYKAHRSTYFSNVWNALDFVNLLLFFVVIVLKVLR